MAELGAFGLSVPAEYGGFSEGGEDEYLGMVVATEELSRASLGIGGSLITRPEILTRALVKGGTEEQKNEWLPKLAAAEVMPAVAVTEPDYGSDVAGIKVTATPAEGPDGQPGYVINGVKTWCTFGARADALALLARTDPDRSAGHRGPQPVHRPEAAWRRPRLRVQPGARRRPRRHDGRSPDRHDRLPRHALLRDRARATGGCLADNLVGGADGTRARASTCRWPASRTDASRRPPARLGVMQAAYDAAVEYAENRKVFGENIIEYQLTRAKLGRMAMIIQASRQFSYHVARLMGQGQGAMEASMVKAYVCKAAEWVTREAMQIHGGFGYAEEYAVSRLFVDARVLSIFEGADETLCLKVIARRLTA